MSEQDREEEDIDEKLAQLSEKESTFVQNCLLKSARRVAEEMRRVAKSEKRLIPYIQGTFSLMNHCPDLLDPEMGREASLEMIGLLESEDRAMAIQADLPEMEYQQYIHWYSTCGYDNLAKAIASINGYNSDGMHACIADGIEVCRRTAKMQCITCFREYATEVYTAADDAEMAIHYARMGIQNENPGPHDRRWAGAQDLVRTMMSQGQLKAAVANVGQLIDFCDVWHTPRRAKLVTKHILRELSMLIGQPGRWDDFEADDPPPKDEFPCLELKRDRADALEAAMSGDFDRAIDLLTKWDRELTRRKCLDEWWITRVRLLAAHKLAGHDDLFERLGKQLEDRARKARDWKTLRYWKVLQNQETPVTPFVFLGSVDIGPYAHNSNLGEPSDAPVGSEATGTTTSPALQTSSPDVPNAGDDDNVVETQQASAKETPAQEIPRSEIPEIASKLLDRFRHVKIAEIEETAIEDSLAAILNEMLLVDPQSDLPEIERRGLLSVAIYVNEDGARGIEVWNWAKQLIKPIPENAVAISLLGQLGASLCFGPNEEMAAVIDESELQNLFRTSLDLDSESARNFGRAGDFYRFTENIGEAERCYARGFRLDRGNAELAQNLARIYRATDRTRDALTVLDMSIRAGEPDIDLLWNAGLLANQIGQHESALTYLDAYEKEAPEQPWVNYYRATSLLEMGRADEALQAVDREAERNPDCEWTIAVQRAAANAALGNEDTFRKHLEEVVQTSLFQVDYLTSSGMRSLLSLLYQAKDVWNRSDALHERFLDYVIGSGLAPDGIFEAERGSREIQNEVNFYHCTLRQPLDHDWQQWPTRLPGEEDYQAYDVTYGVLAQSEQEANSLAMNWQQRAYPIPCEALSIAAQDSGYRDRVGVVWQGLRDRAETDDTRNLS